MYHVPLSRNGPTGGGKLGQWGRSGGGGGRGGGRGVVTRGLLVSGFICNFLDAGSASFFFFFLCGAPFRSAEGRGCCHRARPSWRDGRQDKHIIVRRHSLDRLNASMIEQKLRRVGQTAKIHPRSIAPSDTSLTSVHIAPWLACSSIQAWVRIQSCLLLHHLIACDLSRSWGSRAACPLADQTMLWTA